MPLDELIERLELHSSGLNREAAQALTRLHAAGEALVEALNDCDGECLGATSAIDQWQQAATGSMTTEGGDHG